MNFRMQLLVLKCTSCITSSLNHCNKFDWYQIKTPPELFIRVSDGKSGDCCKNCTTGIRFAPVHCEYFIQFIVPILFKFHFSKAHQELNE